MGEQEKKSTLTLVNGVAQPPLISEESVRRYKEKRKRLPTVEEFTEGILKGNRTLLSQAITLIESSLPAHTALAQQILEKCIPYAGNSIRIGITGIPGVGKSSFIETLGLKL